MIVGASDGPTTKAACLNTLWRAMIGDERREGWVAKAIVLHDAEDVAHSGELAIFSALIDRCDFIQIPVLPLIDPDSRWIGGHYADEFAEAHGKTMVVREAIGAGIPAAGVGCAFSRNILARIADARAGAPFDEDSLTEDYELGLRIAELGARGMFVRLPVPGSRTVVSVRAHFPATLSAAVRQKSRWIAGIALSGWDRLGWRGGFAERWMRLYDRRALVAATVLLAAYCALVLKAGLAAVSVVSARALAPPSPLLRQMLLAGGVLLIWRLAMRALFVTSTYGWREGLRSVPRTFIGNIIAMMAAGRAVTVYLRMRRDGVVRWDKTRHHFPASVPAE